MMLRNLKRGISSTGTLLKKLDPLADVVTQQQARHAAKQIGMTVTDDLIHIPRGVDKHGANQVLNVLLANEKPTHYNFSSFKQAAATPKPEVQVQPAPKTGPGPGKKFG